jgi:hypothetical protein
LHELRIEIAHWSGAFVTETEASPVRRLKVQHGDDDIQLANGQILVVGGDHNPGSSNRGGADGADTLQNMGQSPSVREFSKKPRSLKDASREGPEAVIIFSHRA